MAHAAVKAALERLSEVRGVVSVAVAAADGGLVEGLAVGEGGLAALQELVPTALASSQALGALVGEGPIEQSLVEYTGGPVLMAPIGTHAEAGAGHVLVVRLASVDDLGRVRFQLKRMLPGLAGELSGAAPEGSAG